METADDMIGSWLLHPYTVKTRQLFEQRTSEAHKELLAACEGSIDPLVRFHAGRYHALRTVEQHFESKGSAEERRRRLAGER